ncbi:MAG: hypothetical protein UU80_C0008G0041, partial [candidate division WWE3 bacterium GW2011_GWA1_41_8]
VTIVASLEICRIYFEVFHKFFPILEHKYIMYFVEIPEGGDFDDQVIRW